MLEEALSIYKYIFVSYWWIIAPVALFLFLDKLWLGYMTRKYLMGLKWIMLEVKFPREVVKTPKAMEQFFSGLHAAQRDPKKKDRYLKGTLAPWFSVEILGHGGEIHFYIRTESKYRNLIESHLYAQYPQVEIFETEDYMESIPANAPIGDLDAWGTELILNKEDAYPIRTYPVFFEEKEAEERTDPIAGLFEFLSSLDSRESIGIHILISPTDDKWKEAGEKLVAKMAGKEVKADKKKGLLVVEEGRSWIDAIIKGIFELFSIGGGDDAGDKKEIKSVIPFLTPGQKEVAAAIEQNIAKIGFKTMIRFMYWSPKEIFSKDKPTVAAGFFRQFNTQNLNGFKANKRITPGRGRVFKKRREIGQKRFFVRIFRKRVFPGHKIKTRGFVFNTEELATIFHIPGTFVEVEKLSKIGAKKGSPPPDLPTI